MKVIVDRRSRIGKTSLEVVRQLQRILTIPSNILMMFDERYNHHLALTEQIAFNVRN
jgi:hypothetical protein